MNNMRSNEHFIRRNRNIRNEILKQTDYYMLVDIYEVLSDIQKQEIREYCKKLRDFINENKTKYLDDGISWIEFPKPPEWMGEIRMPKY